MVQRISLSCVRNQKKLQVLLAEKNLGPIVVSRDDCVKVIVDQHVSLRKIYETISTDEAHEHLSEAVSTFIDHMSTKGNSIDSYYLKFILRYLEQFTKFPVLRGIRKLRKVKFYPPYFRSVLSMVRS